MNGTVSRTVVPRPGALISSSVPPSSSARSRIPDRPKPGRRGHPGLRLAGRPLCLRVESGAVVADLQQHPVCVPGQPDPHRLGAGVLGHVLQRLLGGPVHGGLHVARHPQLGGVDPDVEAGERMAQAVQARRQAQVVQDRRAEPGDRGPGLVERRGGQFLGPADLLGGQRGVGADDVGGGGQVEEQADDPLADPVVDLPGQAAAFPLLPFHDALREALQGLLAFGQPAVQPGVLDRPGDQASDRAEQLHVGAGELPPGPGVHVEHAHQVPERGHDRHRHHRDELLAAQRRDVAVARDRRPCRRGSPPARRARPPSPTRPRRPRARSARRGRRTAGWRRAAAAPGPSRRAGARSTRRWPWSR